jgi:hypothetical protein
MCWHAVADNDVRLGAILNWLHEGRITPAEAAARVRSIKFEMNGHAPSVTGRFTQHAMGDIALPKTGSFAEVSAAHAAGKIDRRQYAALAQAAAQSIRGSQAPLELSGQDGNYTGFDTPMLPESVDYRKASRPGENCGACYMNTDGVCSLIGPVEDDMVCTRFVPDSAEDGTTG